MSRWRSKVVLPAPRKPLRMVTGMGEDKEILLKKGNAKTTVGASLLAKNVNDNACCLDARGVLGFFASKLAPTGKAVLPT
ncbi:hypothetical protein CER19_00155 [Pseudomonas sp. GL93]|nr:hypothetical protein CER19_00155 [Pseudomonas sp. GL93]